LKQNDPIDQRKQRIVLATSHVQALFVTRAALANQDRTRVDYLAAEPLDAQALSLRVAAIYG
jgi:hypothetical protein